LIIQSFSKVERGGKREGSGRKAKADELKLIEQMDAYMLPNELWSTLAELCKNKDRFALRTWIEYRYGKPKQSLDIETKEPFNPIQIIISDENND
jgi:hypothetical protein